MLSCAVRSSLSLQKKKEQEQIHRICKLKSLQLASPLPTGSTDERGYWVSDL
jgi:predicted RNA-binding protein YlxR (DUF448 family)